MTYSAGILCLEGEWGRSMKEQLSVEPVLHMLERACKCPVIHRDVGTIEELEYYAERWTHKEYDHYRVAYLAFHGRPGMIQVGRSSVTLTDLAAKFPGHFTKRVIYMGSCGTLAEPDDQLQDFCRVTGAQALLGYTRDVDWVESAAFDVLLLSALTRNQPAETMYDDLMSRYPELASRLGFRMSTGDWTSSQAPALLALEAEAGS